jgi:hypothetical protein
MSSLQENVTLGLQPDWKCLESRVASVVSLKAARCLIQRQCDLQVLKAPRKPLADRRELLDAEIAVAS